MANIFYPVETIVITARCCECRKGEHDDYDDDIKFIVVVDPDRPNRFVCRGNVCGEHREAFESDGYTVRIIGTPTRIRRTE